MGWIHQFRLLVDLSHTVTLVANTKTKKILGHPA